MSLVVVCCFDYITVIFPVVLKIYKRMNDEIGGNSYILLKGKIEKAISARDSMISTNRDSTYSAYNSVTESAYSDSYNDSDEEVEEKSLYVPPVFKPSPSTSVSSTSGAAPLLSASVKSRPSSSSDTSKAPAGAAILTTTSGDDSNPFLVDTTPIISTSPPKGAIKDTNPFEVEASPSPSTPPPPSNPSPAVEANPFSLSESKYVTYIAPLSRSVR